MVNIVIILKQLKIYKKTNKLTKRNPLCCRNLDFQF